MAVTVDAKCAAVTEISAVNGTTGKTSTNLTVGASATALLCTLCFDGSANLGSIAVHWDATSTNVALTQIGTTVYVSTVGQIALFGLVNPVAGAKTLKATWTGTGTGYMASMSFIGTDTSSVANAFTNFNSGTPTGSTGTFNITGANGNYAIAVNGNDNTTYTTFIHATGSTALYTDANENYSGAAYVAETGTTTTFTWAQSGSEQNVVAGCTASVSAGTNASATGVNGTGAAGTVIASVAPNDTGVTGTGAAGTVKPSVGANDTGVNGTGGVGALAGSIGGNLTGAAGTGGVGAPLSQIGANDTGAASTGGVGSLAGSTGGTMGGVGGTGGVGVGTASVGANVGGAAGTGAVGTLSTPGTVNATVSGVGGTGQAGSLADNVGGGMGGVGPSGQIGAFGSEVDVPAIGVSATGYAGTLTVSTPAVAAPIQGGPGDDDDEEGADARRQKWLEWSRKKRLKEKAKLAVPQPVVAKATPEAPTAPGQSLLERNLHAQRLQIIQDMIASQEAARLQEEDDEEAIALLLDA